MASGLRPLKVSNRLFKLCRENARYFVTYREMTNGYISWYLDEVGVAHTYFSRMFCGTYGDADSVVNHWEQHARTNRGLLHPRANRVGMGRWLYPGRRQYVWVIMVVGDDEECRLTTDGAAGEQYSWRWEELKPELENSFMKLVRSIPRSNTIPSNEEE